MHSHPAHIWQLISMCAAGVLHGVHAFVRAVARVPHVCSLHTVSSMYAAHMTHVMHACYIYMPNMIGAFISHTYITY